MKSLIIAAALLVLSGPAFANGHTATAAQWKDIREFSNSYEQCEGVAAEDWYEPYLKKVCTRAKKLADKLVGQGFCFYKRMHVGRPNKSMDDCEPLSPPSK